MFFPKTLVGADQCLFTGVSVCSQSGNHAQEDGKKKEKKKKSEDHPWEDLAKFGYKPVMKYKNFNQLSKFMATK